MDHRSASRGITAAAARRRRGRPLTKTADVARLRARDARGRFVPTQPPIDVPATITPATITPTAITPTAVTPTAVTPTAVTTAAITTVSDRPIPVAPTARRAEAHSIPTTERQRDARGRFVPLVPMEVEREAPTGSATGSTAEPITRPTMLPTPAPLPGRNWTVIKVRDRRRLAARRNTGPGFRLSRKAERILDGEICRIRRWISTAEADFAVVHSGAAPSDDHVRELIAAACGTVDRGTAADTPGVLQAPDVCLDDDGSNPLVTRTWQQFVREGAHAVTVGAPRPVSRSLEAARRDGTGPTFVIRTDAARRTVPDQPKKAYRRPSWWVASLVVLWFTALQVARIVSGSGAGGDPTGSATLEQRWLDAARRGSISDLAGPPLPGSSLWPSLARPILDIAGVAGLRWMSLVFTIVAVGTVAAAGSRLFGRWAARSTAIIVTVGLVFTGTATSATPTAMSLAALGVSMLGIALVEGHDRRSWILMAGLAATVAIVASYQSIVFVAVLTLFFTLLRGKDGLTDSNTFRLVITAGLLAWFLPTRTDSVRFITASRASIDWTALLINSAWVLGAAIAVSLAVLVGLKNVVVRRRVMVLGSSVVAIPLAQLVAGASTGDTSSYSMGLALIAPAVGGAITLRIAKWKFGTELTPQVRSAPEVLIVDPSTGRIRHRLVKYSNRQIRAAAVFVVITSLWYLPWAVLNIDWHNWWLAVPFLLANTCMVATALLSAYNNWHRAIPIPVDVARGHEPLVGVIVPTYAEPLHMVVNTVRSILDQDWPVDRLRIVVSDDAHDDQVRNAFAAMAARLPDGVLLYNRPPKRNDPARRGDSKSGNLNSAILLLEECDYIETRDADDLVGSPNFLRATVGQLMDDPGLGFIQTIKETKTSEGDPFNNNEPFFYRGTMLARNADYAIFPCGSGLVWRRIALKEIDDFPVWNLVEDLHSGVLGLRAGWRGLYVPIVGAYAQHSPEDIANIFKQRGTWALDTIRILVFDRFRGIKRKTRLHFLEQAIFYLLSFPLLVLIVVPGIGLMFDRFPLETDATTYALHFWGFALAIELVLLAMAANQEAGSLWRSRLSWVGMAPIYAKSAIRAVWYGPNRKPAYKVTRKTDEYQVYIKLVKSHWALLVFTLAASIVALFRDNFLTELDLGSLYWGIVAMVGLGAFLRLSWFGVDMKQRLNEKFARPIAFWWPKLAPIVMPIVRRVAPPATDSRSRCKAATARLSRLLVADVQSAP